MGANIELHDDHFDQTTPDSVWIPDVSSRGWVILTKDKNIRRPKGEREDVILASARVFTLTSGNLSGVTMAQIFTEHLERIESTAGNQTPPFVYAVGPSIFVQLLPMPGSASTESSQEDDS